MRKLSVLFLIAVCALLFLAISSSYSDDSCKKHTEITGLLPCYGSFYTSCYDTMVVTFTFHSNGAGSHYAYGVDNTPFSKTFTGPGAGDYTWVDTVLATGHTNHRLWYDMISGDKAISNCKLEADYLEESGQQGE